MGKMNKYTVVYDEKGCKDIINILAFDETDAKDIFNLYHPDTNIIDIETCDKKCSLPVIDREDALRKIFGEYDFKDEYLPNETLLKALVEIALEVDIFITTKNKLIVVNADGEKHEFDSKDSAIEYLLSFSESYNEYLDSDHKYVISAYIERGYSLKEAVKYAEDSTVYSYHGDVGIFAMEWLSDNDSSFAGYNEYLDKYFDYRKCGEDLLKGERFIQKEDIIIEYPNWL